MYYDDLLMNESGRIAYENEHNNFSGPDNEEV